MMKRILLSVASFALAAVPFANAQAEENINIYGWQNWSYEFVDADKGKDLDRLSNNAANIGFMSHMDTGIDGLQVGLRCEQFTYWGRFNKFTDWCNRNSKISLRHERLGELMFGQWLLPYNEIVAQWIDPFYDAGADSHTSIMGNIGGLGVGDFSAAFYNGSFDDDFGAKYGALTFNRRQEGVVQYVWPNTSDMASQSRDGFQFRFAVTEGSATDERISKGNGSYTLDERIWSTGAAYQRNLANGGQVWVAAAYEQHDDVSALAYREFACEESDDSAWRLAGRYVHDWGNGQKTQIGAMWEELDYDADDCGTPADVAGLAEAALVNANANASAEAIAAARRNAAAPGVGGGVERDAWMVSGKHSFGNGFDVRFSYMDADELECDSGVEQVLAAENIECENDTDADAFNLGLFYTMPAGTELRLTYSEVSNEDNAQYDFGINTGGSQVGEDVDMVAIGIVHWFD